MRLTVWMVLYQDAMPSPPGSFDHTVETSTMHSGKGHEKVARLPPSDQDAIVTGKKLVVSFIAM